MDEYIEREAAYEDFEKCNGENPKWTPSRVKALIARQKTADVAPVRHGRWIPFHSTAAGDIQYCSACDIGCTWRPNYCPNCGALMDLEGGDGA